MGEGKNLTFWFHSLKISKNMPNNRKNSILFRLTLAVKHSLVKTLALLFCFGLVAIPLAVAATVHGPNECCKLDHDLTDIDPACAKDAVVAAKGCDEKPTLVAPAFCDCIDTDNDDDSAADECWCHLATDPPGVYSSSCEEQGLKCWCDPDDDGINEGGCIGTIGCPGDVTKNWGLCCVVDTIYNVTDILFYILMSGVAIIFVIAGFLFLSAGGDPMKVADSKRFLIYGLIGLALALLARIIPAIIKGIVS